jgi:hypothetical protein
MSDLEATPGRHAPRPLPWLVRMATMAFLFFSVERDEHNRSVLGRPLDPQRYQPFDVMDFLLYLESRGKMQQAGRLRPSAAFLLG